MPATSDVAEGRPTAGSAPDRSRLDWIVGLGVAVASAGIGAVWCRWCLRSEFAGLDVEAPSERVTSFALLVGGLVLLAWLTGARTRLGQLRAPLAVVAALVVWTIAGLALFAADQLPAWPGFAGPLALGDDGVGFAVTWTALAGPTAIGVLAAAAAWLGARGRPTSVPVAPADGRLATWVPALGVILCAAVFVGLQVLDWAATAAVPWPASDLVADANVLLLLAVVVAWFTSGNDYATAPLVALSVVALLLAYDGAASTLLRALMVPVGVVAVLVAALRRPVATTLRGLLR